MGKRYKIRICYKNGMGIRYVNVGRSFTTQKQARKFAMDVMDEDRDNRIVDCSMSNPDYMDEWQVSSQIRKTDDGRGYYWVALYPYAGWKRGSGHYLNRDGSISKRKYQYY